MRCFFCRWFVFSTDHRVSWGLEVAHFLCYMAEEPVIDVNGVRT